jgi:hypothetical protein
MCKINIDDKFNITWFTDYILTSIEIKHYFKVVDFEDRSKLLCIIA